MKVSDILEKISQDVYGVKLGSGRSNESYLKSVLQESITLLSAEFRHLLDFYGNKVVEGYKLNSSGTFILLQGTNYTNVTQRVVTELVSETTEFTYKLTVTNGSNDVIRLNYIYLPIYPSGSTGTLSGTLQAKITQDGKLFYSDPIYIVYNVVYDKDYNILVNPIPPYGVGVSLTFGERDVVLEGTFDIEIIFTQPYYSSKTFGVWICDSTGNSEIGYVTPTVGALISSNENKYLYASLYFNSGEFEEYLKVPASDVIKLRLLKGCNIIQEPVTIGYVEGTVNRTIGSSLSDDNNNVTYVSTSGLDPDKFGIVGQDASYIYIKTHNNYPFFSVDYVKYIDVSDTNLELNNVLAHALIYKTELLLSSRGHGIGLDKNMLTQLYQNALNTLLTNNTKSHNFIKLG